MNRRNWAMVFVMMVWILTACGQKGPLVRAGSPMDEAPEVADH